MRDPKRIRKFCNELADLWEVKCPDLRFGQIMAYVSSKYGDSFYTEEEQINGAQANINVAEKRRVDLVYNLVDAVQAYQDYEGKTLEAITAARSSVSNGDIDEAKVSINAVAEAYPELKANENYQQLMNELAMTENQIAQYRNNYNEQVRAYNKMIRSFPNNVILSILGYERIETTYTDYGAPVDAPQNLFDNGN